MNKSPANRFEAFIVPSSKRKLQELQREIGLQQVALVSRSMSTIKCALF